MTNIEHPSYDDRHESPDDQNNVVTAIDPSELAFRTKILILLRYLVDTKKVPIE